MSEDNITETPEAGASAPEVPIKSEPNDINNEDERSKVSHEDERRAKTLRQKQLDKLKDIKVRQQAEVKKENEMKSDRRLDFLMEQAEVFAHFMSAEPAPATSTTPSTGPRKRGRPRKNAPRPPANNDSTHRGHHRLTEEQEDTELMAAAMDGGPRVRVTQQPSIMQGGQLRDYQIEGVNWMVDLHDNGINGILADEMGLGKTVQTIALMAFLKQYRGIDGPHIIIVPKSTMGNWCKEFERWCPAFRVLRLQGAKEERKRLVSEELMSNKYDVVVTSFETVIIEKAALRKFQWRYIVIDEAHRIKNESSALSTEVRNLDSQHRLLLTGTPLQNNLHELWALLNFLLPDVFSSSEMFDEWFSSSEGGVEENVIKKLHTILKPFLLRRLKSDVEHSLLPKIETKLYVGMTAMQRAWYKKIITKDATSLNQIGGPDRVRLLNILMQLRKVCNHPYLFEGAEPGPPYTNGPHLWQNADKMLLLDKLLPKLREQGSRVLIFSQMTRMLDILEDYLLLKEYEYCRIDGNTKGEERDKMMDDYNAPNSSKFAFLLSTRAGGLGINLYTADVVILYDSDWNPQMDLQAQDRAHRIGQKKQVRVFRFITENTVEEKIIERAERKLYLDAVVVQQGRLMEQHSKLSKNELMTMVRFGADEVFRSKETSLTDNDIDAILATGAEKTQLLNEKIKRDMSHNLANFRLENSTMADKSVYEIGEFSSDANAQRQKKKKSAFNFIELPQRERKQNYDIAAYYRSVFRGPQGRRSIRETGQVIKIPTLHEHQFFNKARLTELYEKENALALRAWELQQAAKEKRKEEATQKKKFVKQRIEELLKSQSSNSTQDASSSGSTSEEQQWARDQAEREYDEQHPAESDQMEREAAELVLSPEDKAEQEKLLEEGYGDWSKRDFRAFISACERYGRDATNKIIEDVAEATDKSIDDVKVYHDVFWKRYKEMNDWEKVMARIEKGEERLERRERVAEIIALKVARFDDPFRTLSIRYGQNKANRKGFSPEEDRFLVCMMNEVGYGEWDAIRIQIRQAYEFRFDWFIKSRSSAEIARRCEQLIRLIEKEIDVPSFKKRMSKSSPTAAKKSTKRARNEQTDAPPESDDDVVSLQTENSIGSSTSSKVSSGRATKSRRR